MKRSVILLWIALTACSLGCSGATFDGTIYRGNGYAFAVPPRPAHYKRLNHSGDELAFKDERSGASILLAGRCGTDRDDVPLTALTQHLFLQFTERKTLSQQVVPFDRREAIHTVMDAKLDGVVFRYDAWILKKDGCIFDLLYFNAPARFDEGVEDFRQLIRGFATVSSSDG